MASRAFLNAAAASSCMPSLSSLSPSLKNSCAWPRSFPSACAFLIFGSSSFLSSIAVWASAGVTTSRPASHARATVRRMCTSLVTTGITGTSRKRARGVLQLRAILTTSPITAPTASQTGTAIGGAHIADGVDDAREEEDQPEGDAHVQPAVEAVGEEQGDEEDELLEA